MLGPVGVFPWSLKNPRRRPCRAVEDTRKRNKSVVKWEYSSRRSALLYIGPLGTTKSKPYIARVRDTHTHRNKIIKTFPSEYSFAICLISLAFLTELCVEGDGKKESSRLPLTAAALYPTYLPNFCIFMQSGPGNNSDHLSVPFFFIFSLNIFYTQMTA